MIGQNSTDTFECSLYELEGLAPPGTAEIHHQWSCDLEATELRGSDIFVFSGDIQSVIQKNFNVDITEVGGNVLTIPWEAVNGHTINSYHEDIRISFDPTRRERHLVSVSGKHEVLIVRVKDKTGISPKHWASHIQDDFFQDNNNMVRFGVHYEVCQTLCFNKEHKTYLLFKMFIKFPLRQADYGTAQIKI